MAGLLAAVLMTAIAPTLAGASPPSSNESPALTTKGQGFTASFAAPPQVIGQAPTSDDDSGYWIYAGRSSCAAYSVRVDQYPKSMQAPAPNQRAYDLLLRAHAAASSSRIRAERPTSVGGLTGLEGEFVGQTGAPERVQVVMAGRRVYQISYTETASAGCADGEAFLTSFQIITR